MQGSMLSAFYYGFGATQIFGGWISDRIAGSKLMYVLLVLDNTVQLY